METAIVEVCGEYWFRCPKCESLNINSEANTVPEGDTALCPDCGAEFVLPEIQMCECSEELTRYSLLSRQAHEWAAWARENVNNITSLNRK